MPAFREYNEYSKMVYCDFAYLHCSAASCSVMLFCKCFVIFCKVNITLMIERKFRDIEKLEKNSKECRTGERINYEFKKSYLWALYLYSSISVIIKTQKETWAFLQSTVKMVKLAKRYTLAILLCRPVF